MKICKFGYLGNLMLWIFAVESCFGGKLKRNVYNNDDKHGITI